MRSGWHCHLQSRSCRLSTVRKQGRQNYYGPTTSTGEHTHGITQKYFEACVYVRVLWQFPVFSLADGVVDEATAKAGLGPKPDDAALESRLKPDYFDRVITV